MDKIKKIFMRLFVESNRYKHFIAGVIIYILMMIIQLLLIMVISNIQSVENSMSFNTSWLIPISTTSFVTVFIAMCSVEYIQKKSGGIFDLYDIFAGCFIPIVSTVVITVLHVL